MNKKDDLALVFKGDSFEAEVVKARLESDGIQAMIMNNSMSAILSTYTMTAGSVCVLVNDRDKLRAQELLGEE